MLSLRELADYKVTITITLQPRVSAAETARQLVALHHGDIKAAQAALLRDLKARYPGFQAGGKGTGKGGPFYAARLEYDSIRKQLNELALMQ